MRRLVLLILALLCLTTWAAAIYLLQLRFADRVVVIPTLIVLPSLTPTNTLLPTTTPTFTSTYAATSTTLVTDTLTPTPTSTLSTRVLEIHAVMPGVSVAATQTPIPLGVVVLSAPPQPLEPLPDATNTAPPFTGWYSFESDYPTVRYRPLWEPRLAPDASRGQYHRTENPQGAAAFTFEGEGMRIRYVAAQNMGIFDIEVDGMVLDTVDAFAETLSFRGTRVYVLQRGTHELVIRGTGIKQDRSTGYVTGLDAIQVFRSDANIVIQPAALESTPTPTPRPVQVELISAPPTVQPTATVIPPRLLTAGVLIAYDENNNRTVDPAEGVAGVSVRVVEVNTNRVIASGYTDARGAASFSLVLESPLRMVVPYFGQSWEVGGRTGTAYTLLIPPSNQPGLIP